MIPSMWLLAILDAGRLRSDRSSENIRLNSNLIVKKKVNPASVDSNHLGARGLSSMRLTCVNIKTLSNVVVNKKFAAMTTYWHQSIGTSKMPNGDSTNIII